MNTIYFAHDILLYDTIVIISCHLLDQKVDMPQCKLSKDFDLEPNF